MERKDLQFDNRLQKDFYIPKNPSNNKKNKDSFPMMVNSFLH